MTEHGTGTIRPCIGDDLAAMEEIINDAARAYRGRIPADCWKEPYMDPGELRSEIEDGVVFYGFEEAGRLVGVMGLQDRGDVCLIRHAYVLTPCRRRGIGEKLLAHLRCLTEKPVLVGTWKDATWAVSFYEKHGFRLLDPDEKDRVLRTYWSISERQVETSVVLGDGGWFLHPRKRP
ncbi:MAG TPA: GNAT family N-acetyltransferase [Deltaproteobacteria bacterium]|jgi:N-acetylglutamate synthase-like GNAT family acetyltransferase|nr:GNAT family N-acetyltransferase [Deltaproteobacteria bacterium]HOI07626.1 GNAT family N-acetyltransferase [Deltaproteobacteria bacterium]